MAHYLLAIDQGTTSSRAIVFSAQGLPVARAQQEFKQYFPQDGWVEHDGEELWLSTLKVCREALKQSGLSAGDGRDTGVTAARRRDDAPRIAGPGIIGRERQVDILERGELREQVARRAIEVLGRIARIDAERAGRVRHQLPQTVSALWADGGRVVAAFSLDQGAEQDLPVVGTQTS